MPRPVVAVVPLRAPGAGKSRLAPSLDPRQRGALATAMLTDVLLAVRATDVDEVVVAADGAQAEALATALGVRVHRDAEGVADLDAVIAAVVRDLGDADVLVVAGDLPCLIASEVEALLDIDTEVGIAATNGGGTGGLLRRPGDRIATAYGPSSAARHHELARTAGATVTRLWAPGFRHDVDTWTDLVALHELEVGPATAALLPGLLPFPAPTP